MKDYSTLKYAISDYTGGNTTESEFIARIRTIENPNPSVIECINAWDTMLSAIRSVKDKFIGLNGGIR